MASQDDFTKEFVVNDGLCPKPVSGPRVTVAFWAIADIEDGDRPEITDEPNFTLTYPVGRGESPYSWKHNAGGGPLDINPNSANNIVWTGHLTIHQLTEYACRQNLHNIKKPEEKPMCWALFRDMPDWLWGRIYQVNGIHEVTLREEAPLHFCAPDGHYIRITESGEVTCDRVIPNDACRFLARFPDYQWDNHGGCNDQGEFCLQACNGLYLRATKGEKGQLRADAPSMDQATKFTTITAPGSVVTLRTKLSTGDSLTLQHDPPYGELYLTNEPNNTWNWFNISYACANFNLFTN